MFTDNLLDLDSYRHSCTFTNLHVYNVSRRWSPTLSLAASQICSMQPNVAETTVSQFWEKLIVTATRRTDETLNTCRGTALFRRRRFGATFLVQRHYGASVLSLLRFGADTNYRRDILRPNVLVVLYFLSEFKSQACISFSRCTFYHV